MAETSRRPSGGRDSPAYPPTGQSLRGRPFRQRSWRDTVRGLAGRVPSLTRPGGFDTPVRSRPGDPRQQTRRDDTRLIGDVTSYDQQQVVKRYIERLQPKLDKMAHEFAAMNEQDLQWQVEIIAGILSVLYNKPELAVPLFFEATDLQDKLIERRDLEAESLKRDSRGNSSTTNTDTDTASALAADTSKTVWSKLTETFTTKIDPDIWKLIAHLRTVKEWSITGEVSANVLFMKGQMGLSITFGE
jgi:hypothetical protein